MDEIIREKGTVILRKSGKEFDEFRYKVTNINYREFFSQYSDAVYYYNKQCIRIITPLEKLHEIDRILTLLRTNKEERSEDRTLGLLTSEIRKEYFDEKVLLKKSLSSISDVEFDELNSF